MALLTHVKIPCFNSSAIEMIDKQVACSVRTQTISLHDLPLACPYPDQAVWNAHPRVYLAIEESPNGEIECPYCSTQYVLEEA